MILTNQLIIYLLTLFMISCQYFTILLMSWQYKIIGFWPKELIELQILVLCHYWTKCVIDCWRATEKTWWSEVTMLTKYGGCCRTFQLFCIFGHIRDVEAKVLLKKHTMLINLLSLFEHKKLCIVCAVVFKHFVVYWPFSVLRNADQGFGLRCFKHSFFCFILT